MIARAVGGDTRFGRFFIETEDRIGRAANLEGTSFLKIFTLEEQLSAGQIIQERRRQNRCPMYVWLDPFMRNQHVLQGWDVGVQGVGFHAASFEETASSVR